jgi:hypothetical protein
MEAEMYLKIALYVKLSVRGTQQPTTHDPDRRPRTRYHNKSLLKTIHIIRIIWRLFIGYLSTSWHSFRGA